MPNQVDQRSNQVVTGHRSTPNGIPETHGSSLQETTKDNGIETAESPKEQNQQKKTWNMDNGKISSEDFVNCTNSSFDTNIKGSDITEDVHHYMQLNYRSTICSSELLKFVYKWSSGVKRFKNNKEKSAPLWNVTKYFFFSTKFLTFLLFLLFSTCVVWYSWDGDRKYRFWERCNFKDNLCDAVVWLSYKLLCLNIHVTQMRHIKFGMTTPVPKAPHLSCSKVLSNCIKLIKDNFVWCCYVTVTQIVVLKHACHTNASHQIRNDNTCAKSSTSFLFECTVKLY